MPDFESKVKASKIMWAKRLQSNTRSSHFAEIFGLSVSFKEMCMFNYDVLYLEKYISPFYKQILRYWYELQDKKEYRAFEIRQHYLWFKKFILVGNKPLYVANL